MKKFDIPLQYQSSLIGTIKEFRKQQDPRKSDFSPTLLDFGNLRIYIARHFGFCFGVENAVEISFKTLADNPGKRIFLLSQMIHNPAVNKDLEDAGIRFIMDTDGKQFIPWEEITSDDIVIIPAFGTTLEIESLLKSKGVSTTQFNTTCPFVERVWNRAKKLGSENYTIIIHGKHQHEETRATFSHSQAESSSMVIKDKKEAQLVGDFILGKCDLDTFNAYFAERLSKNFDPLVDFNRIGVINQTTMLANETQEIADYFKQIMIEKFPNDDLKMHFADTRDTLCYATNDNQQATIELMESPADLAIVIGGYNSSNTSHLVELLEQKFPSYFIKSEAELIDKDTIEHFDLHSHTLKTTKGFLGDHQPLTIAITSGASCPDAVVDRVLQRIMELTHPQKDINEVMARFSDN